MADHYFYSQGETPFGPFFCPKCRRPRAVEITAVG